MLALVGGGICFLFLLPRRTNNIVLPTPTPSATEQRAEAQRHLKAREYKQAQPLLQKAADVGNTDAMDLLGQLYKDGNGGVSYYKDGHAVYYGEDDAYKWFQKAADAGNSDAMYQLGDLYSSGGSTTTI